VALNWLFDYFLPRSIVQIANRPSAATSYRHYATGDVICRPGQTIDGLYSVISGAMESRISNQKGHDDFIRLLRPGDHWGERSLARETLANGTLIATEETVVLVLRRADFVNLSAVFPQLREYFDNISDETYAPSLRGAA
jgi:CRP-like cAMP-binding protein